MKFWLFPLALSAMAAYSAVILLRPAPMVLSSTSRHRNVMEATAPPSTGLPNSREATGSIR